MSTLWAWINARLCVAFRQSPLALHAGATMLIARVWRSLGLRRQHCSRIGWRVASRACGLLLALILQSPRPIWRVPSVILACGDRATNADTYRLSRALLVACGLPPTRYRCWALSWARCFEQAEQRLLTLQMKRLSRRWLDRRVRIEGELPPGGAILLTVHHRAARLGLLALADRVDRLATIAGDPALAAFDPEAELHTLDANAVRALYLRQWLLSQRKIFGGRILGRHEAGRKGLRFLEEGGYLVVFADVFAPRVAPPDEDMAAVLGRVVAIPRGPAWFGQRSGRPIIPFVVISEGSRWRIWLGEAIPPTQDAVAGALDQCIRRAPAGWQSTMAMSWLGAPPAS
jgi:hypothetical protein